LTGPHSRFNGIGHFAGQGDGQTFDTHKYEYIILFRPLKLEMLLTGRFLFDNRTVIPYILNMQIASVSHRGLRRFIEDDDTRGIRRDLVGRIRNVLTALIAATDMDAVQGPPGWRIHQLSGDRAGTWSISVSGNWRLTFRIQQGKIHDLNLEDYH
jgi:proteic killer suppression protein